MTIQEKEEKIVAEFQMLEDWMDKYNYLIELGKSVPMIDEQYKTPQYIISGCQSRVWLFAEMNNGRITFSADSDAVITKGLVNLLIDVLNEHSPDEILATDFSFLDQIGLKEHLSPTRSNGLNSMIKQIKLYALAFKTKQSQSN